MHRTRQLKLLRVGEKGRHALPVLIARAYRLGDCVDDDQTRIDALAFNRGNERLKVAILCSEIWRGGNEMKIQLGGQIAPRLI
jgi:hypothetical protein